MRLIDAAKLGMHLADFALSMSGKPGYSEIQQCIKAVEEQPTVDPVIHAYWRDTKFCYGECSECGEWTDHYTTARYCVNCGARMDRVKI